MKKILSALVSIILVLCLAVGVCASDKACTEIPLTAENLGSGFDFLADVISFTDGGFNAKDIEMTTFCLDKEVAMGETVVVRIIGTSTADFRVWLIGEGVATASNQVKLSTEFGFTAGEFDYVFELTATDHDSRGITVANEIAVKGPSYGTNLEDITVDYLGIFYGTMDEYTAALAAAEEAPAEEPAEETPAEEPAEEAPAEDAPVEDTPVEEPAETGIALAAIPAVLAMAVAVISKKR